MANRDGIFTDDSEWPLVIHTTVGIPSEEDVEAFISRADALLARGERHAIVFDNSRGARVPAYMRQRSMEWMKENDALVNDLCVSKALVIRSAALRFAMATLMLVTRHRVPEEVFDSREPAVEWSREQLRAAGITIPERRNRRSQAG